MRTQILLLLGLAMVFAANGSQVAAQSLDTAGVVDTLMFGRVAGPAGAQVKMPVVVSNDVECISLTVPVWFPADRLIADSVSFASGRIAHFGLLTQNIDQADGRLLVAGLQLGGAGLMPGSGAIAWIHFTISANATPGDEFAVDTGYINDQSKLLFLGNSDGSMAYVPAVMAGAVQVIEPNSAPSFLATGSQAVREGDMLTLAIAAVDADGDRVRLSLLNRPHGASFAMTGLGAGELQWLVPYTGPYSSVQSPLSLMFAADDGIDVTTQEISVTIVNVNRAPQLSVADTVLSSAYTMLEWDIVATDPDNDPVTLTVSGVPSPAQVAPGNPLQIQWQPVQADTGYYPVTFRATDPNGAAAIVSSVLQIVPGNRITYSIDTVSGYTDQNVTLTISMDNKEAISGIELLLYLDPTAATITGIDRAGTRIQNWEMFAASQNHNGRPGDIHIVALADLNDGTLTPNLAAGTGPVVSVHLRLISDDAFAGFSFPTRFVFHSAMANTATDAAGEFIMQSEIAYSHGQVDILINENRLVGDINLNGLAFEVGDVVYLANYFSNPAKYPLDFERRANSDVNLDGISATIADLVFMINVITSGVSPKISPSAPVEASWNVSDRGELWMQSALPIGGIYFEYKASSALSLQPGPAAQGMTLQTGFAEGTGRGLLYSLDGAYIDPAKGALCLGLGGAEVTRLEVSDVSGFSMASSSSTTRPERLELLGNYPNPFNPATAIRFSIESPGHVQIDIFNILGSKVAEVAGQFQAGSQELIWDGRDSAGAPVPSGVYFYRFEYQGIAEVKRMLLLK